MRTGFRLIIVLLLHTGALYAQSATNPSEDLISLQGRRVQYQREAGMPQLVISSVKPNENIGAGWIKTVQFTKVKVKVNDDRNLIECIKSNIIPKNLKFNYSTTSSFESLYHNGLETYRFATNEVGGWSTCVYLFPDSSDARSGFLLSMRARTRRQRDAYLLAEDIYRKIGKQLTTAESEIP